MVSVPPQEAETYQDVLRSCGKEFKSIEKEFDRCVCDCSYVVCVLCSIVTVFVYVCTCVYCHCMCCVVHVWRGVL